MKWTDVTFDANTDQVLRKLGFTPQSETLPEDVFVVGYPKSGNNWVQNLLVALVYNIPLQTLPFTIIRELMPGDREKYFKRHATPMFFRSHKLPNPRFKRVIYLVRDGRDVMVSYRHFLNGKNGTDHSLMQIVQKQDLYPTQWHTHVEQWMENPFKADFMLLKYEDLKKDVVNELQRICSFIGVSRDLETLQWVAQQGAFDSMRQREQTFGHSNPKWPKDKAFMRSGQVGSHENEMADDVLNAFMQQAGQTLRKMAYTE